MSRTSNFNNQGRYFGGVTSVIVIHVADATGDYEAPIPSNCFVALAWFFKGDGTGGPDDSIQLQNVQLDGTVLNVSFPQSLDGTGTGSLVAFSDVNMASALLQDKATLRVHAVKDSLSVLGVMVILVAPRPL